MKNNPALSILLSVLIGFFVFFVGIEVKSEGEPSQVYKVYLNGQVLGNIKSQEALLNLIDEKQEATREKYQVTKVHPPRGLEIKEEYTYAPNIVEVNDIYEIIQDKDPFTISGYTVTIKYPTEEIENENGVVIKRETKVLNILNKKDFEEAFKTVMRAFVGPEEYEMYVNDTQAEIVETGSKIETIYWEETITIKESFINVDAEIFTNEADISKYLFFATTKEQKAYTIKEGDDIESISAANNLNTEEFLVANPQFTSKNVLLTPGQSVNVGLIAPMVTVVSEIHLVEDLTDKFKTEYVDDDKAYLGSNKTIQEGSNGTTRVTEKILYKNGEIQNLVIVSQQEIIPVVNKIVSRGTKGGGGGYGGFQSTSGNEDWSWPTVSPFVITSRFAPRWGGFHKGLDISGTGFGSPIRSVQAGTVIKNEYSSSFGHWVVIRHDGLGYITAYAHLAKKSHVAVGTKVNREQVIGYMGNSGRSFGTHLHLEVQPGTTWNYSGQLDPCKSIFKC